MTDTREFLELSRRLTGLQDLPDVLAGEYRERLLLIHSADVLTRAAVAAEANALPTLLTSDGEARALCEDIAVLWYASATVNERGEFTFGTLGQYFAAQLWNVIQAHPPGLSGGYMGHWRYPPE